MRLAIWRSVKTMTTVKSNSSIWQLAGGPASRPYAAVFLQHGIGLIGPGDAGP
jgi:hypothetical protein